MTGYETRLVALSLSRIGTLSYKIEAFCLSKIVSRKGFTIGHNANFKKINEQTRESTVAGNADDRFDISDLLCACKLTQQVQTPRCSPDVGGPEEMGMHSRHEQCRDPSLTLD